MDKVRRTIVLAGVVSAAVGYGAAALASGAEQDPVWLNPDGTVEETLLPVVIDVLDCEGNVVSERWDPFGEGAVPYMPAPVPGVCGALDLPTIEVSPIGEEEEAR